MNGTESRVALVLLLSVYLSTSLSSTPPLSSIHKIHTQGTHRKQEGPEAGGRKGNENERRETVVEARFVPAGWPQDRVDVLPPLASHFYNWLDKDGRDELEFLRRVYYRPRPRPRNASTPVEQRNVGVERNVNKVVTRSTTLYEIAASTRSPPPPPPPSSSSCSTLTCTWFYSWQFTAIAGLTATWILVLMSLSCIARTPTGRDLLDAASSCCPEKDDSDNQVLARGIGYFDGSPGMRRFVFIEDEDDEEDENFVSEPQKDEEEESEAEGNPVEMLARVWRPPRKGTYILQEATKDYMLELGTYRLQEDVKEDVEEDKVEYVLEGATYILQSEIEERGRGGGGGERIGGIGGLHGIMGGGGRIGEIERGRIGEIEGLYGIIKQGRGGNDGVILSVSDLEGDKGGGRNPKVEESTSRGGGTGEGGLGGSLEVPVEGRRLRSRSTVSMKRAASFPMDNYYPLPLLPRKLSLIMEEEML